MIVPILIILGMLLLLTAFAAIMLYKERKHSGNHCVGCPYKDECAEKNCREDNEYEEKLP